MQCPNCHKELTPMQDKGFSYCPKKTVVVKFGEPYDRKFKITLDPESGCGTLFAIPMSEQDYIAELDRKYRPVKNRIEKYKAGHGGVLKSQTRTT